MMQDETYAECSREPIHLIGRVQGAGQFLICDETTWDVLHAADNIPASWGCDLAGLLGSSIKSVFSRHAMHAIANAVSSLLKQRELRRIFSVELFEGSGELHDLSLYRQNGAVHIEIEQRSDPFVPEDNAAFLEGFIDALAATRTMADYLSMMAKQVRLLTAFDRTMVYRFDEDGSGEVVAESLRRGVDSFLGLRYPATDIPDQARRLFAETKVRAIGDARDAGVAIHSRHPSAPPVDIGMACLRAVAPVHLRYLGNMGVVGSLSIAIIVEGRLWGLIACHHASPKWLPMERRAMLEMLCLLLSMQLEARLRREVADHRDATHDLMHSMLASFDLDKSLTVEVRKHVASLMQLIPCDSLGFWVDSHWHQHNMRLSTAQLSQLLQRLDRLESDQVVAYRCLAQECPAFADAEGAPAGMLAIPISRSPRDYLLFFRNPMPTRVRWAGNPHAPKQRNEAGGLDPRASFAEWCEEQKDRSEAWSPSDIATARRLHSGIIEFVLKYTAVNQRQLQDALERQRLLVAELNHRVKNILALIQSLMGQGRSSGDPAIQRYVMNLKGRIAALAAAHDNILKSDAASRTIKSLLQSEFAPYESFASRYSVRGVDVVLKEDAYSVLALVIHELVTNAVKYGALSNETGKVELFLAEDGPDGGCSIEWRETGGPIVRAPEREGLGSVIVRRLVPHELKGDAEIWMLPAGFKARYRIPAAAIDQMVAENAPLAVPVCEKSANRESGTPVAALRTALVVDDNMLIALDTESMLIEEGILEVEIVSSVEDAMRSLRSMRPDIAVLDINLGKETSLSIADHLEAEGIPYLFLSGYSDPSILGEHYRAVPSVQKPAHKVVLRQAISDAVSRAAVQSSLEV